MEKLTNKIQLGLGVPCDATVQAKPYKLVVYPKCGQFKQHRDAEKAAGMFGSLIIVLPCELSGGNLVVRHKGGANNLHASLASKEI